MLTVAMYIVPLSLLTTCQVVWYMISVVSCLFLFVCLYICQTIMFESLDIGISYLHIRYISREYGSSSYMKIIRSRSRLQGLTRLNIPIPAM